MYLVQAWALPAIPRLNTPIKLAGEPTITIKGVDFEPPNASKRPSILLEMEGTQEKMGQNPYKDMRYLGKVLSRLSFNLLTPFSVFSARLIPKGLQQGERFEEIVFPGSPPGISISEHKIGFRKTVSFDPIFLAGELPVEVDGAISWFLNGHFANNPIQQVVYDWVGLEMLAPPTEGPWKCSKCGADVPTCPSCGKSTEGVKAVATIQNFLESQLNVTHKEFRQLYELRCKIIHGGVAIDPDGNDEVWKKAGRIHQLLLDAIKKALNWPIGKPPIVESSGFIVVGSAGIALNSTFDEQSFYNKPRAI